MPEFIIIEPISDDEVDNLVHEMEFSRELVEIVTAVDPETGTMVTELLNKLERCLVRIEEDRETIRKLSLENMP